MIGWQQLLIVLVIIILIFGTKKLRNVGGDLGSAVKNFRKSVKDGEEEAADSLAEMKSPEQADPEKLEQNEAGDAQFDSASVNTAEQKEKTD